MRLSPLMWIALHEIADAGDAGRCVAWLGVSTERALLRRGLIELVADPAGCTRITDAGRAALAERMAP